MQFMATITWDPGKRDEMVTRARTQGVEPLKDVKVLGEWIDIHGGRAFRLIEADDPKSILLTNLGWSDICKIEAVPVLPVAEAMGVIPAQ
jgi:Domain of unknown function (DUF3303)